MSGTVGVAAVTAGPGLTNTVTAVKNAQMAESPVLLMGGAAASILKVSLKHLSRIFVHAGNIADKGIVLL
jgi:thiamine pyrophosphate-dependent acetolactate synthase large subunit-like protein